MMEMRRKIVEEEEKYDKKKAQTYNILKND